MELFIIRNGEQTGPFSTDTITALLNTGSLKPDDMAWRKGLSAWIPLTEAMNPDATTRDEPPPLNGAASPRKKATAKQKALLGYLGATFHNDITKDEAALVISDTLENPKHAGKLAKWNEEKLRLHADLFQDEIDYRRGNRVARYLELCQTEGAEAVKDVTKAHVQVLIESLDKRNPTWEQEPRRALWDFLLPCVGEHFPQLVREEWKGKLRFGGAPKIAAAVASTPTAGTLAPPNPPGAIHAAMRGIIYGAVVLGMVLSGMYWYENRKKEDGSHSPEVAAKPAEPVKKPVPPAPDTPPPAPAPAHPTEAPAIAANPLPEPSKPEPAPPAEKPPVEKPPAPVVAANTPPMTEPAPAAPAPSNPSPAFTPAPPPPPINPPPGTTNPLPAPAPAPAPAAAKEFATMTKAVAVQLQFGRVILQVGTRVKFIAIEGPNARVTFNNNVILVPLAATDIDPNALPATVQTNPAPPTAPLPAPPAPPPTAPTTPVKPSSDL